MWLAVILCIIFTNIDFQGLTVMSMIQQLDAHPLWTAFIVGSIMTFRVNVGNKTKEKE